MQQQQHIIATNIELLQKWYEKIEVAKKMRSLYKDGEKEYCET